MTNFWHISDTHLSFDQDGKVLKPMHERRWARGSWTYVDYLGKMKKFSDENITDADFVAITGDIVHDMKEHLVVYSLRWLRANIKGTIIVCRGNHDKYWDVGKMRQMIANLPNMYLIDEGEILSIGPFTVGCFSNHSVKTEDFDNADGRYLETAINTVTQAKLKNRTPIMLSHYPVNANVASAIGKAGIKAYLSGHVHCTSNEPGNVDGVLWTWYDFGAGHTDDKVIDGCFFSTATTDVVLAKHGKSFKEITHLKAHSVNHQDINNMKAGAVAAFGCKGQLVNKFEKRDPFNGTDVVGFICREKGLMQGSLYITHVNGVKVSPQLIHGTPKLAYPYKNASGRDFIDFPKHMKAVFMEKWNGMNVLFYRYEDVMGKGYVTAKSKGTPFLTDSDMGNFLSLTKEVLGRAALFKGKEFDPYSTLNKYLERLAEDSELQAVSFELCGKKEPHLVKYSFEIDLKPLFAVKLDGSIYPLGSETVGIYGYTSEQIIEKCKEHQALDFDRNKLFRLNNGLEHKYEYEHFTTEGKVLYLLDQNGYLVDRTMYKIKPEDVEEVHWQTFDQNLQGRVQEAVRKIKTEQGIVNEDVLRQELDMGPKEWGKFGRAVMEYLRTGKQKDCEMVVLVGLPGSGKSTVAKILQQQGYVRVNQDELGSRNACKRIAAEAFAANKSVVVDRCNFNDGQRRAWIELAKEHAVTRTIAVHLDVPADVCYERAAKRKDHPTIPNEETARKAVDNINSQFTIPERDEGFSEVLLFSQDDGAHEIAKVIGNKCNKL